MRRTQAKLIAEKITNEELQEMFDNARTQISDWTVVSICNKGFSKGVAWNILASDFNIDTNYHIISKTNMVREFGAHLPNYLKPPKKEKSTVKVTHHDPIFKDKN